MKWNKEQLITNIQKKEREILMIDRWLPKIVDDNELFEYLVERKTKMTILLAQYNSYLKQKERDEKA